MDAALVVSIVAAVFAGLAAIFAGWSAWSSHRSAELASEVVKLERDRHHRDLSPKVTLEHDDRVDGVWFANAGPLDYASIWLELTQDDAPIAGFHVGREGDVVDAGSLGPLAMGERRLVRYQRSSPRNEKGLLSMRLTCESDRGTWTIPAQVEIPGSPWPGVEVG
jgi:hypothetical protein